MDISYSTENIDFREGGVHFLSVRLCRATVIGDEEYLERLSDFLWGWQTDILSACERTLLPMLRQAYMDDPSPRKRFTHRPCVVCCTVTHETVRHRRLGDTVRITRRVDVTQGTEVVTLLHETDRIELTYGCFIS